MDHHKLFEGNSNVYTKFRPKTPQKCLDWILEYLSEEMKAADAFSSAADIGCGTGKVSIRFYLNDFNLFRV